MIIFCRAYRAFYILNWIYRYFTEQRFTRWIGKSWWFTLVVPPFSFGWYSPLICYSSLRFWSCPDSTLCRFLLLLLYQVTRSYPFLDGTGFMLGSAICYVDSEVDFAVGKTMRNWSCQPEISSDNFGSIWCCTGNICKVHKASQKIGYSFEISKWCPQEREKNGKREKT